MKHSVITALWISSLALSVSADAPPGRYTINDDGTVLDTRTQLTWLVDADITTHTQADAISWCASSELSGGGWRLPQRSELLTLADPTRIAPAIDPVAFPDTPSDFFWSATVYAGDSSEGWTVMFLDGNSGTAPVTNNHRVRCVR